MEEKMYSYKFKNISLEKDWIKIKLVERFKDWKYDKFIPMKDAIELIPHFVFNEEEFDSVMSKSEQSNISKKDCEQSLFDMILDSM